VSAVAKLEALLARVQTNRTKPRALAAVPAPVVSATPTPAPAPLAPIVSATPTPAPAPLAPIVSAMPTPAPAPPAPIVSATPTPAPAPLAPVVSATPAPESNAEAITPPRGLRTPLPQSPTARAPDAAPLRPARPTPLEMAIGGEIEHVPAAATPAAAKTTAPVETPAEAPVEAKAVAPTSIVPPSIPIVRITSEPSASERPTFGGLLRRTLALRPR
jgi:hypothetical protein